ncbi:MAG TPA: metal-dependent hydrolase [Terriglobales bacterium]|nr:metal-dependent hydrolase [Terriglobales bacterium]
MNQTAVRSAHAIPVRKPSLDFAQPIPRFWFKGNFVATHFFNGLNMLFPDGERFFVKAVHDRLDRITDPVLREQAKGFAGQEGQHANQHEKYFDVLREQGYQIDTFLRRFRKFCQLSNRWMPAPLRLSITAGAEHYTAIFGANVIEDRELLGDVHPTMRNLLLWHATEEIEHKSVAFDVLKATHPSYLLRVAGFAVASIVLFGWAIAGCRMLLRQDRIPRQVAREHEQRMIDRDQGRSRAKLRDGALDYFRRDFHPSDTDELTLAHQRLEEIGIPVRL